MSHNSPDNIVLLGGSAIARYTIADKVWEAIRRHFDRNFHHSIIPIASQADLRAFVDSVRSNHSFIGGNVALPWKKDLFLLCDAHDSSTQMTGIASAFTSRLGKLTSFNMDAVAIFTALEYEGFHCNEVSVLILGAGGAGSGLAYFLAEKNNTVFITDHDDAVLQNLSVHKNIHGISRKHLENILPKVQVIVNATTVGNTVYWGGDKFVFSSPLALSEIRLTQQETMFVEMNYRPYLTHFLEIAQLCERGVVPGVDMLILQALFTFREIVGVPFTKHDFHAIKSTIRI